MSNRELLIDHTDTVSFSPQLLKESYDTKNGHLFVKGVLQRADAKNQNGRVYPKPILEREVENYKNKYILQNTAYGELDHPERSVVHLTTSSHIIRDIWWEGNDVMGLVEVLPFMTNGSMLEGLFKSGLNVGISSRGLGSVRESKELMALEVQDDFELVAFDFVSNPSTYGAFMKATAMNESSNNSGFSRTRVDGIINSIVEDFEKYKKK